MAVDSKIVKSGLAELGLARGDVVLVHSDLRQLGKPRELVKLPNCGADLVIDAFLETVGPEGLVIVPTFTSTFVGVSPDIVCGLVYDPAETPGRNGSITNIFRKRPGAHRSSHPTHSVTAIGERAAELCEAPEDQSTFDRRGPWGKMYDWDGYVCWFGTDNHTNTTVHVVEDWMDLPYMETARAIVKGSDGRPVEVTVTKSPNGPRDFYRTDSKAARLLEDSGIIRRTQIAAATVSLMKVRDVHRVVREGIIADPCLLLLEDSPDDPWTRKAREEVVPHVRSRFSGAEG